MDFNLPDELHAILQSVEVFASQEIASQAAHWDEHKIFPQDVLRKAAALGLAGIYVRDDIGGSNLSRLAAALIFETLSNACVSTAAYLSIHNMVAWMIDTYSTSAQRQKWLPPLLNMDKFASYCLTEPEAGSDAAALRSTAVLEGDHYVLNGSKSFTSGGSTSGIYLCMVRTGAEGAKGISAFIVEGNNPGISFGKPEVKLGWNSQITTMVFFENCRVPVENLIGELGQGFKIALSGLNGGRVNIAACSLGGASACLQHAKNYSASRKQFGQPIQEFQSLQFKMADMYTDLEAARLMVYRAAASLDNQDKNAALHCAMAKRFATDAGFNISNQALQIFGGYGYLRDYPIERYFRDLRVHQILEGTNEIMRLIISRHFFNDINNLS